MGYRSKVIMGVKNKYVKGLEDLLIDCDFNVKKDSTYLKMTFYDDEDMKIYQMDYIKWYGLWSNGEEEWNKKIEDYIHEASEDNDNAFLVGMV